MEHRCSSLLAHGSRVAETFLQCYLMSSVGSKLLAEQIPEETQYDRRQIQRLHRRGDSTMDNDKIHLVDL